MFRDDSMVESKDDKTQLCPGSKWCRLFKIHDSTIDTSKGCLKLANSKALHYIKV